MNQPPTQLTLGMSLGSDLDFGNFVAAANADLLAQAQNLAVAPQFLYVWGERGAGKTHLLHAACRAVANAEQRVALLPFGDAAGWDAEMLEGWETLDLVALDDIQCVAKSVDWERKLFSLYNNLRDTGASLLVTADRPPASLEISLPDLRSRFGAMLVYQLHALDDDGRLDALSRKAKARGMDLPEDVGRYLLTRVSRNMADLASLLDRLDRDSLIQQRRLTIPFVRQRLEEENR